MTELFADAPLSVSALNRLAKNLLEKGLSGLWVGGEVSNLTRAASGHCYFVLKDTQAQVRCTLFRHQAAAAGLVLKEGDSVELTGRITLYEARGEFQINVSAVRRRGLGVLFEAYERLKNRLQAEGLFDAAAKRPLPAVPAAIGIVTSPAAAALRDVVSTLRRRAPEIPLILYPAPVQGAGSGARLADAVGRAVRHGQADVLIVCRGGGSLEDLWAFNEEVLVRAVAACPIPVVSGVGHETDFTLADFAADVRAPTPTAAAELCSPDRAETAVKIRAAAAVLRQSVWRRYTDATQQLDRCAGNLHHPLRQIRSRRERTAAAAAALNRAAVLQYRTKSRQLGYLNGICRHVRPDIAARAAVLAKRAESLHSAGRRLLAEKRGKLGETEAVLSALSPQQVLARGYSVVKNSRGGIVRSAGETQAGETLLLMFCRDSLTVRVDNRPRGVQDDLFDSA